jgi:hypothetical protein
MKCIGMDAHSKTCFFIVSDLHLEREHHSPRNPL